MPSMTWLYVTEARIWAAGELQQYAADKGMRRFGTISSARGRPLEDIDVDYSPLQLEDTFADEDQKALAASA